MLSSSADSQWGANFSEDAFRSPDEREKLQYLLRLESRLESLSAQPAALRHYDPSKSIGPKLMAKELEAARSAESSEVVARERVFVSDRAPLLEPHLDDASSALVSLDALIGDGNSADTQQSQRPSANPLKSSLVASMLACSACICNSLVLLWDGVLKLLRPRRNRGHDEIS